MNSHRRTLRIDANNKLGARARKDEFPSIDELLCINQREPHELSTKNGSIRDVFPHLGGLAVSGQQQKITILERFWYKYSRENFVMWVSSIARA